MTNFPKLGIQVTWILILMETVAMEKCQVLHIGGNNEHARSLVINSKSIEYERCVRDLGVIVSDNLRFTDHINKIVTSAYQRSNLIFRAMRSREPDFLKQMFITYVRPLLEYCVSVWSPYHVGEINMIESVQKRFTKRIPTIREMNYAERLDYLQLEALERRRTNFDLNNVYKIVNGVLDVCFEDFFEWQPNFRNTRGNGLKIKMPISRLDVKKYSFSSRVVKIWNSLPGNVVHAPSIESFKAKVSSADLNTYMKGSYLS